MDITSAVKKNKYKTDRLILHSDCNGFYASVECLHNPQIRSRPVAVGGSKEERHGIILAKNEIAKKYGIKTGETIWQAQKKCPDLTVVPPHFELYKRFSKMARRIYRNYTDRVEPFGLDEAWLDVTELSKEGGRALANEIRRRVKRELGITVSVGVSFNKIFAKFGSDYKKPDAVTEITRENYKYIVWSKPADDLLYVGRATAEKLKRIGVYTIGDIARTDPCLLRGCLGKWGELIYGFANGYDSSPVARADEKNEVKSIGNSTTTPVDMKNSADVKTVLYVLCDSVCRRLREHGLEARTVCISLRDTNLCTVTHRCTLNRHTSLTKVITRAALELFGEFCPLKRPLRSVGVNVSDLTPCGTPHQMSLLRDEKQIIREEKLDRTLDELKRRFGSTSVRPALLLENTVLSGFDPKEEHTIHPVGYF